jgi:hypothetical protein
VPVAGSGAVEATEFDADDVTGRDESFVTEHHGLVRGCRQRLVGTGDEA